MSPRRMEVAPLQKLPCRGADDWARAFAVESFAAAQKPPQSLARCAQRLLEPSIESALEQFTRYVVGRDLEHRIDSRFDRALAQKIGAKRMDRADSRLFKLAERIGEPHTLRRASRRVAPRVLDFCAQPQLELSGGLLGEGHGDDSAQLGAPAPQCRDDPVD